MLAPARLRRVSHRSLREIAAVLLLCLPLLVPSPATATPAEAKFGVYVTAIHGLDVNDSSYSMDLYVWWISRDRPLNPVSDFQIVNGRQWQVRSISTRTLADGSYYTAGFVSAKINHTWNMQRYPFDRHVLRVMFETPFTAEELRLIPDVVDSRLSDLVDVPGFRLGPLRMLEHVKSYDTRFGLKQKRADQFSRVLLEMEIQREASYLATTLFTGLLVANVIGLLIFLVDVSSLGVRSALATTAILAAAGNMYILGSSYAPASQSLLVARCAIATFVMVVVALIISIAAEWLVQRDRGQAAMRLNWSAFAAATFVFVAYISWSVFDAMP